jgi:heme/copper-type cytochrome/quinol oxidase subunit 2
MTDDSRSDPEKRHFTTRRGFVAACGFGIVGLYGLWAGYGAAPVPFLGRHDEPAGEGGAHEVAGGGHGMGGSFPPEEFRRLAEDFAARFRQPDGSVRPGGAPAAPAGHAGHGMGDAAKAEDNPDDVYLMAYQWGFAPAVLRLEANRPYRLRMMAVDVSHGAAIRLGPGSRIVRLRANTLVEQTTTFTRPGEHLVYCTVYCGPGHARMQGRLIVA